MKIKNFFSFNNYFSWRRWLNCAIEFFYLAPIFLIPVWFAFLMPTFNVFELNKAILFKIFVLILFLLTIFKTIFCPENFKLNFQEFFKKYYLIPIIFIAGLSLISIFSIDPLLSFYGAIERQGGLVSYLFCFVWFILVSFNIVSGGDSSKKIRRIVVIAAASGFLVSVYGILQILGLDFLTWPEDPFITRRTISSFGQPNFLASWLALIIPLNIYLYYSSKRFFWRFAYLLSLSLQLICLFLTGSRGGLFGLIGATIIFFISLFFYSSWSIKKKVFLSVSFLTLTLFGLLALNYFSPGRIVSLIDYNSGSVAARLNFYSAAADAIKKRPLIGYGLEGGEEVFIRYYESDWAIYGDVGQSSDRAHNLIFDILLSVGIFGLLIFIIFYYFFFSLVFDNIKKKKMPHLSLALALGAVAYLLSLMFSFSTITGEIYFWLFLAILIGVNFSPERWTAPLKVSIAIKIIKNKFFKLFFLVACFFVFLFLLGRELKTFRADYYFNKLYFSDIEADYRFSGDFYRLVSENSINPVYKRTYDRLWAERLCDAHLVINNQNLRGEIAVSLEKLDQNLSSNKFKDALVKARINGILGNTSMAQEDLRRLSAITPHWPFIYLAEGRIIAARDFQRALTAYYLLLLNLPDPEDSRLNPLHRQNVEDYHHLANYKIADIYILLGNWSSAENYYRSALKNKPEDYTLLKKIADTYYYRGDLDSAIKYNQHGFVRSPDDYNWPLALAALYYEKGDKKIALEYLDLAILLDEDNSELKEIKQEYEK